MKTEYLGITIDRTRDRTMPEQARELVKGYYLRGKEKSPQEAYARASVAYCDGDLSLAQRLYDAVSNGWFMFSSPVLSNAPAEGEQAKGLPISCFLSYVPDTLDGLIEHQSPPTTTASIKASVILIALLRLKHFLLRSPPVGTLMLRNSIMSG